MSQNIEIVEIQSSSCSARFVSEEERQMIKTRNSDDLEEQRQTYLRRITSEELQMMREIFDTVRLIFDSKQKKNYKKQINLKD